MLLLILSNFAFSIGESFVASFLPDLGPPEDLGKISGFGWALGYIGGMVSAVFVLLVLGDVSAENFERIRWVGPWAGLFFLARSTFRPFSGCASAVGRDHCPGTGFLRLGLARVRQTITHLRTASRISALLLSVFFSMSGICIIITYAFIYGAQVIAWDESVRTLMFVLVQITAAIGAFGFGFCKTGSARCAPTSLTLAVDRWRSRSSISPLPSASWRRTVFGLDWQAQHIFLVVGCVAGISLGACQSTTRTLVGLFSPHSRQPELFGFWGALDEARRGLRTIDDRIAPIASRTTEGRALLRRAVRRSTFHRTSNR